MSVRSKHKKKIKTDVNINEGKRQPGSDEEMVKKTQGERESEQHTERERERETASCSLSAIRRPAFNC